MPERCWNLGCGIGTFLADARDAGWQVSGLDINAEFPEFCRKELDIADVKCGVISDPPFAEASFDAVAMLDVLEHMYDPMQAIKQCARQLKPGGLLVVKSPNGAMQLRKERFKKMLGRGDGYVAGIGHLNQTRPRPYLWHSRSAGSKLLWCDRCKVFSKGSSATASPPAALPGT